jgi:Ca2+-binding RTX toxin-like protein
VNADLSAVANRIARDWVLNNSEGLKAVLLTEDGPDGWAGRNLAGASFTDLLADLDGLQITLPDTLEILAVRTSETDAADILDRLATVDDVLGDTSSKSFGIAEYAGLWVVIADTRNLSDDAEVSKAPVVTYANGGAGNDLVLAGSGKARTNLYEGNDVFMGGSIGDLARGGAGADELHGNGGRDKLFGNGGGDLLDGGKGNDRLIGGGGGDTIIGGAGNDKVKSGKGNDMLDTGKGRDTVKGGAGRDIIDTGKGRDTASGGGGRDVFVFEEGDGRLKIKDFSDRADKVDLTDFGFAKLADVLDKIEDTGIELVLDFGQAGRIAAQNEGALLASDGNSVLRIGEDEIMFIGITKSDFDSDDFIL